jgi:D-tyrosyl-tRNA(Tyr) deacylase
VKVLLQRVKRASVTVDSELVGSIGKGLLLLVGVAHDDGTEQAAYLAAKVANMRIFPDAEGRMNRSVLEAGGAALVVSQFTLYANVRKGRRPSFIEAAAPAVAVPLVANFVAELEGLGVHVEQGRFGALMDVELVNDGPVTIWLDTSELLG